MPSFISSVSNDLDLVQAKNVDFSGASEPSNTITTNGQLIIGSTALNAGGTHINIGNLTSPNSSVTVGYSSPNITLQAGSSVATTYTANSGSATPSANNLNVFGNNNAANGFATFNTGSASTLTVKSFGPVKWIVNPTANIGTHQTIQSAINSAVSGETIFVTPGTYTENLTLKAGVNIVAFMGDQSLPNVTIIGNATFSSAGSCNISNIRLQTNSAAVITVSGSAASVLSLNGCYINATNNTAISFTSSSSSASVSLNNCSGNLGTTGIAVFAHSSAGSLSFTNSVFSNTGGSSTANTISAGSLNTTSSVFFNPITTSGTSAIGLLFSVIDTRAQNATCLTCGGSGSQNLAACRLASGTAASISISSSVNISDTTIVSSNANPVTGAGTVVYSGLMFESTGSAINTTTITRRVTDGGEYQGRTNNTAPSAGMIGEIQSSSVAQGSAVSVPTATPTNITTISLSPGIWDVNGIVMFRGTLTGLQIYACISTTSTGLTTIGNNAIASPTMPTANTDVGLSIPQVRINVASGSTQTMYLVANMSYTVGTGTAYGRISAVRVA